MNRREWFKSSFQILSLLVLEDFFKQAGAATGANGAKKPYLVISRATVLPVNKPVPGLHMLRANDVPGGISLLDVETGVMNFHALPVAAHIFNQHPQNPHLLLGAVKWSPSAVVFDLKEKKQIALLRAPKDHLFFGHACFHPNGKIAFLSANSYKEMKGALCVFDCQSWKMLEMVDSGGAKPHECYLNSLNEICMVNDTSEGTGGRLAFIDPDSFKVKKSFAIPCASHIASIDNRQYLISGGTGDSETQVAVINTDNGKIVDFHDSVNFPGGKALGEALSLCVVSPEVAIITLAEAQELMVLNMKTNRYKTTKLTGPALGTAKVGARIFVTAGKNGVLSEYKLNAAQDNLELVKVFEQPFGNGRHMRAIWI